jgi:hypothetical protein
MNYMECRNPNCGRHFRLVTACPGCGEVLNYISGDLHLFPLFDLDVYIDRVTMGDQEYLLIKKPSGQVWIQLSQEDKVDRYP